ncbi:ABC transporter permease [Chelatococcus sp. YT9]|uniref:ABC transporter permease n=1 Tax=Chelatococcus sp. YT9 TaxID=2835635 RepID=UPI001BD042AF|nr:ABC transporter permease [Chelatococcus sp. YT9]MBS7699063.1 ABC transporter permease [Chelatococcus sp. YT9]
MFIDDRDRGQLVRGPALRGAGSAGGGSALTAVALALPRLIGLGRFKTSRALIVGGLLLAVIVFIALTAGMLYPGDPRDMVGPANLWPGVDPRFPLGTDMMGRDMAAAMAHSASISLIVGVAATAVALIVGVTFGALAGYCGGVVDDILMRISELFQTMPGLLFTIIIVVILGPSIASITFAIGITSWPQIARLVRAEAFRVRQLDFVLAAVAMGMSPARVILRHVLPNSLAPVVVAASILVAQAILSDASLSFLGLGDPNVMSWGSMVGAGRPMLRTAWYMTALPGGAIFLTVMSFMLIGNGLNDLFNPRTSVE